MTSLYSPILFSNYKIRLKELSRPVEIYFDYIKKVEDNGKFKVFVVNEPRGIKPDIYNYILGNSHFYDLILTWDKDLLSLGRKNFKDYTFYQNFVKNPFEENNNTVLEKEFSVSTVVGSKSILHGHKLRHELWSNRDKIAIPKKFYASSYGPLISTDAETLGESKIKMFKSQFHIAIENINSENMYSEKINDCMITKTVPIYWGCSNIGEIYNPKGIIQVDSVNDLITKTNFLTKNTYENMLPFIEDNYNKALELSKISLCDVIEKFI